MGKEYGIQSYSGNENIKRTSKPVGRRRDGKPNNSGIDRILQDVISGISVHGGW